MPKISEKKIERLKEEIIAILYSSPANPLFTSEIAEELIRDEEFTLKLLKSLHDDGVINEIKKNKFGKTFLSRRKWTLKSEAYTQYKKLIN